MRPFPVPMIGRGGGGELDSAATAYLLAAGITNPTRQGLVRDFFTATVDVLPKLDRLWLLAAHSSLASRTCLVSGEVLEVRITDEHLYDNDGNYLGIFRRESVFTADRGWAGGYPFPHAPGDLRSTLTQANATHFSQDNAFFGVWRRVAVNVGQDVRWGQGFAGSSGIYDDGNTADIALNDGSTNNAFPFARTGFLAASRTSATAKRMSRNGTSFANLVTSSVTVTTPSRLRLVAGDGSTAAQAVGAALTDAETSTLYTALNTYLTAIGAA